jgi:hypothetical protein
MAFWNEVSSEGLPLNVVFSELAEMYQTRHKLTSKGLSEALNIRPQSCSQWKSGSDNRQPTWSALVWLCDELNMQIVVDGEGVMLKRRRKGARK